MTEVGAPAPTREDSAGDLTSLDDVTAGSDGPPPPPVRSSRKKHGTATSDASSTVSSNLAI